MAIARCRPRCTCINALVLLCALLLPLHISSVGGGSGDSVVHAYRNLDVRGRSALIDRLRQMKVSRDECSHLDQDGMFPERCEESLQELADKAQKWWVAEGRQKHPHIEPELIRRCIAEHARQTKAERGEVEDPAETGRWPRLLIRPWWYMTPLYYKFDFDTCLFALPLRSHPQDEKVRMYTLTRSSSPL